MNLKASYSEIYNNFHRFLQMHLLSLRVISACHIISACFYRESQSSISNLQSGKHLKHSCTEKLITVLYTSHSVRCCFISLSISCGIEWISSKMNKNYPVTEPDGIHKLDWMTECYCVVNIVFLRKLFQQTWHRCILSCDWCGEEDECLNSKRAFSNYRATLYNNHY